MADATSQKVELNQLFESCLNTANKFWKDIGANPDNNFVWSGFDANKNTDTDTETNDDNFKTYRTWETTFKNFFQFLRFMLDPENQGEFAKGTSILAESIAEATGESLENVLEFQSQLLNSFTKFGEHTKAYNFDDIDHSAFESFRDFYRSELQKYLYIPKIGLPREFHEQLSQLADKSNIFHSYLFELIYLFYIPFEKSSRVMQKKIERMIEKGEFAENSNQLYSEWIKVLEGHFMQLLKSKDYTDVLNNTIGSLAAYKNIKNDITNVFLKELQIPTNKDMDDVYRDLYLMKKKIRKLSQQVYTLQQCKN